MGGDRPQLNLPSLIYIPMRILPGTAEDPRDTEVLSLSFVLKSIGSL